MMLAGLAKYQSHRSCAAGFLAVLATGVAALLVAGPAQWRRRGAWLRLVFLPSRDAVKKRTGEVLPFPHASFSLNAVVKAMEFRPRPTDVFILTPPKTGTTWMQTLCHSIRTAGLHTDFEDIYQVVPWDQLAWDLDQDLAVDQVAEPRLFKTHLPLSAVTQAAKYICVIRDVEPTLLSWYNFLYDKEVSPATSAGSASEFVMNRPSFVGDSMRFGPNLWGYYSEFAACLDLPNVLVLAYEDLVADLEGHLDLVTKFLGVPALNPDARSRVLSQCSRDGMLENASKYDESWTYKQLLRVGRAPYDACSFKPSPRVKEFGRGKQTLNAGAKEFIAQKWREEVFAKTDLSSYSELRARVSEEVVRRQRNVAR